MITVVKVNLTELFIMLEEAPLDLIYGDGKTMSFFYTFVNSSTNFATCTYLSARTEYWISSFFTVGNQLSKEEGGR